MVTQAFLEAIPLITEGIPTDSLTDDQLKSVLAYELWKDGCDDFEYLSNIVEGTNPQFRNKKDCIQYLKTVFGRQ